MPYDNTLRQDIGADFAEDSRPTIDIAQIAAQNSMKSLILANQSLKSELTRFNGDVEKAYDFYNNLYQTERSRLNSYNGKIVDFNNKIIRDQKLLTGDTTTFDFTPDSFPQRPTLMNKEVDISDLGKSIINKKTGFDSSVKTLSKDEKQKIIERLNYNKSQLLKYSSRIDNVKKNCKNYKSVLEGLDKIRKSTIKKKILDTSKKALLKTAKASKEVAKTTLKATIDGVETSVGATLDAASDSAAAGASATVVGAPVGIGIKAGRVAGKTAYKTTSTTTKGLVHAADKTAMSASKALKESVKLTKIQTLLTGYDDPKEMVKTVGQKGLNLATSTFFMAFNFAVKEIIKLLMSPILYLLGVAIIAYLVLIGVSVYSSVSSITAVIDYITNEKNEDDSIESNYGSGQLLAEIAIAEYEASWETDSEGNQIRHLTEADGVQNKYIDRYNELASTSFGYGTAWCAIFVTYCCDKAGLLDDGTYTPMSYCPNIITYFEEKGLYHEFGDGYSVKVGDLAIHSGHVGIVVEVNENEVVVISGNSSQSVGRSSYADITTSSYTGYIEMPFKSTGTKNGETIYLSDDELLDFAAVIAGEAGNDEEGTLAVATVIMNRYEGKGGYANYNYSSIYEVTHASGQFAAVNDATYKSIMNGSVDISTYPNAYSAAKNAMNGYRNEVLSEHNCTSFRTHYYYENGKYIDSSTYHPNGIDIGGNWFFW